MKKRLQTAAVLNELKGALVFFQTEGQESKPQIIRTPPPREIPKSENAIPQASDTDSSLASNHDSVLEEIRQVVKVQGKKVSYVRLTQAEKNQLADIIYTYRRRGVRTTETEISRIGINYLM